MAPNKVGLSLVDRLRAFQRSNQANKRCADCPERGPTYVCLDFMVFVCQTCCGLHREFGHKIKSISFSEWSEAEVAKLEEGGNEAARTKWLDRWHAEAFPEPDGGDVEALREFIRLKYVEKKWFRPHGKAQTSETIKAAGPETPAATVGYEAAAPPSAPSQTVDLLSGGDPDPTPAKAPASVAKAEVSDLLGGLDLGQSEEQPWTADFSNVSNLAPKAPVDLGAGAGLIDLDFGSSPPKAAAAVPESDAGLVGARRPRLEPPRRKPFLGPQGETLRAVCSAILVVELAERLCYYALAGSQEFFLEQLGYSAQESAGLNSAFTTLCYVWPLLGGYVADAYLGRYHTIIAFTVFYLVGVLLCATAAIPSNRDVTNYLVGSMGFLALGTGGIKPNISNFGADQFDSRSPEGRKAREEFYTQFYTAINLGALLSYGFLTTLCSSGFPGVVPPEMGYCTAYFLAFLAMLVALLVFLCYSGHYRCLVRRNSGGDAIRGVFLHVVSATSHGSLRALMICVGFPLLLLGLLLTVVIALLPGPGIGIGVLGAVAVLAGLVLATIGCQGNLSWVHERAQRNSHVTRQQTADFLRVMPTLAAVNLAFNSLYNCMTYWFQEQACLMDVRLGKFQLNGSFFNVADCIAIVLLTPVLLQYINPTLERFCGVGRHGRLLLGIALAAGSVASAAHLEVMRRHARPLQEASQCAPPGRMMSSLSAWWMVGPYALMGAAEVLVNPSLYYLAYSQTPLRLRSSAQAMNLLMSATSNALFTVLTAILGDTRLRRAQLEVGYYVSLLMAIPCVCWYVLVQCSWEERFFDETDSDLGEVPAGGQLNKGVAYQRTGMLRDFVSPQSPGGSPANWVDNSPLSSGASAFQSAIDDGREDESSCAFVLVSEEPIPR
ncbi:NPF8.2 [Symbiodinium sp. CCMP2592]|nr:NPF8.2 [Symbiodinium sp. CCMP2592]